MTSGKDWLLSLLWIDSRPKAEKGPQAKKEEGGESYRTVPSIAAGEGDAERVPKGKSSSTDVYRPTPEKSWNPLPRVGPRTIGKPAQRSRPG